jgi:integrase
MSVYKRKWRGRGGKEQVRWVASFKDQLGRRHQKGFILRKEAKDYDAAQRGELIRGAPGYRKGARTTVAEAGKVWLQCCAERELGRFTLNQYEQHLRLHIAPQLGAIRLTQLTTPAIERFRKRLLEMGHTTALTRKVVSSLSAILSEAQRQGWIAHNPVLVRGGPGAYRRPALVAGESFPTEEEIAHLIERADQRLRPLLAVAADTGLQVSELLALAWDSVDLGERPTVAVCRNVDLAGTFKELQPPRARTIPLAARAADALREWRPRCPPGPLGLVFPNTLGARMSHNNLKDRRWVPLLKTCGYVDAAGKPRYQLQWLRRAFAVRRLAQGTTIEQLAALLGHRSLNQAYEVYGGFLPLAAAATTGEGTDSPPTTAPDSTELRVIAAADPRVLQAIEAFERALAGMQQALQQRLRDDGEWPGRLMRRMAEIEREVRGAAQDIGKPTRHTRRRPLGI